MLIFSQRLLNYLAFQSLIRNVPDECYSRNVPDECYSRNASYTLHSIPKFYYKKVLHDEDWFCHELWRKIEIGAQGLILVWTPITLCLWSMATEYNNLINYTTSWW